MYSMLCTIAVGWLIVFPAPPAHNIKPFLLSYEQHALMYDLFCGSQVYFIIGFFCYCCYVAVLLLSMDGSTL